MATITRYCTHLQATAACALPLHRSIRPLLSQESFAPPFMHHLGCHSHLVAGRIDKSMPLPLETIVTASKQGLQPYRASQVHTHVDARPLPGALPAPLGIEEAAPP